MYNPNVPSSNMGIAPISGQPSQPMGPAPMGPPPPMMGGMPPPPMMAPPPMAPPIAPITEGLGGFGGSSAGRAGFSERMQKMTAPPKPKPQPQQMQQPVQGMQYGGMVRGMLPRVPSFGQLTGRMPYLPQRDVSNPALLSKSGGGIDQYGEYLNSEYGDPEFDQKRDSFLQEVSQKEQQTFGGGIGGIASPETNRPALQVMNQPFMGGALQQGFPSYGIHRFNSSPFGGRLQLFEDGGEVPRDVSPIEMALGGFIGNENTRDYSRDFDFGFSDSSYEDEAYEGDYGDVDYGGGPNYGGGGDDDDYNRGRDDSAPPVSPPSDGGDDGSGGGGGGGGGGGNDPASPVSFPEPLAPDVASDFETFTDLIDPFEGQIVQPTVSAGPKSIDAVSATPVVGSDESGEVVLEVNPISLSSSGGGLTPAPRTTAASEAARRSMSDAPLGGSEALINPFDFTRYGNSRNRGIDAEAKLIEQGILAGDNQLNAGGMYPSVFPDSLPPKTAAALENAAKTAAFATQGMTPGTPEYLSKLIETADAASKAGDVPSQLPVAPSVTLEGMGIDPANIRTEEDLRREREKYKTPGVGDAATAGQVKILEDIAAGEDITSEGYGLSTPSVGSDLTREDVIRLKRGLPSGEPAVVSADPSQPANIAGTDSSGGPAPKSNFDFDFPNTGKTDEVFIDPTDSKVYFDDRFDKTNPMTKAFNQLVSSLSYGLIDLDKISKKQRDKGFEAYKKTQTLAYDNKGRVIGVKDVDGSTILLGPQPLKDDTDREDGCPPGFRRVNGVCQPINGVSPNPADDIADDIKRAIGPIIRPLDPSTGDVTTDPVTDEPSGIDFRRPNYFAGGGAVSEGMGSAIDSFISAMGGSVKKKSNVAPVGMANGGYVDVVSTYDDSTVKDGFGNPVRTRASRPSMSESEKDERNFSYDLFPDDVYGRGGRGVNAAPVYPDIMSSGFFDPAPAPVGLARSLRPQLRPDSFELANAASSEDSFELANAASSEDFSAFDKENVIMDMTTGRPVNGSAEDLQTFDDRPQSLHSGVAAIRSNLNNGIVSSDLADNEINRVLSEQNPLANLGLTTDPNINVLNQITLDRRLGSTKQGVYRPEQLYRNKENLGMSMFPDAFTPNIYKRNRTELQSFLDNNKNKNPNYDPEGAFVLRGVPYVSKKDGRGLSPFMGGTVDPDYYIGPSYDELMGSGMFNDDGSLNNINAFAARSATEAAKYDDVPKAEIPSYLDTYTKSIKGNMAGKSGPEQVLSNAKIDPDRPTLNFSPKAYTTPIIAHEYAHLGDFEVAKKYREDPEGFKLEYGDAAAERAKNYNKDTSEDTVQYYDNTSAMYPNFSKGFNNRPTSYYNSGIFDQSPAVQTDSDLQQKFTDFRLGKAVDMGPYTTDENAAKNQNLLQQLIDKGLYGGLLAVSDLNAAKYGLGDPYAYRSSQGLKINPVGAARGEVLRSAMPRLRPQGLPPRIRPRLRPQGLGSLP